MLLKHFLSLSCIGAALLSCAAAHAHHTAASFYDLRKTISVLGTVTAVKLANPHSYFRLKGDDGRDWAFESGPSFTSMIKRGWSADTIRVGTRVRFSGAPSRDGTPISRYSTIFVYPTRPGGDAVLFIGVARAPWVKRAQELGHSCGNGVSSCVTLAPSAVDALQREFGNVGVWSAISN